MQLSLVRSAAALGIAGSMLAGVDAGAGAAPTTVRSRDILTAHQILRGTMSFQTPREWHPAADTGVYTARFTAGNQQCAVSISASIRGKATRRSAATQARDAIGENTAAAGRRPHGVYRVATTTPSPSSTAWLYGIAVVRVAPRRFGQLRIFASFKGSDCSATAAPDGNVTRSITTVLRHAKTHLRIARTR